MSSFQKFMNRVRYWDHRFARWMMNHFFIIFFEFVLVLIFFVFFFNLFGTFELSAEIAENNLLEKLIAQQLIFLQIITVVLILNSFWLLFVFNGIERLRVLLKDISFNLTRRRHQNNT